MGRFGRFAGFSGGVGCDWGSGGRCQCASRHSAGDVLLRQVAERIARAIRPGDTVARFGGDEFVVVCDDVSATETEQVAERVLLALSLPMHLINQEMHVSASLGIAISDEHATP